MSMVHQSSRALTRRSILVASSVLTLGACAQTGMSGASNSSTAVGQRKVLWAANVRSKSLAERLTAAQVGGFTHMSVFPIDYRGWRSQGMSAMQIRQQIRVAGIRVLAVDPFVQWVPNFQIPSAYPADYRGFIDFSEAQILEIAQELEAEAINCVEGLGQPYPRDVLVERFGSFADRAKARGLRVTLEFMPISSIQDLSAGWAIVQGANRSNAGLCFDTWHYFRSKPDDALLQTIPGERIFEVQLADALVKLQGKDLTDDLLRFRRLPGQGELPIARIVPILKRMGAWKSVGPEVFADAMDALSAQEAGRQAGQSLAQWL
jgi:sugar phosphate isomerase/epimerase